MILGWFYIFRGQNGATWNLPVKQKKPPQAEAQGGVIKRESGFPDLFGLVQYLGPYQVM
nr:MAG TPA: hypothetical protein [Caudoviricetes sp.]